MDVILVNFGVNYAVDCIKHAQCTSELKQLATLTNEGELDIFSFHGETFRKVVLHGVTAFRWCEDGKSETTDQKFVAITKDEVCFYSTNFAKIGPSDLLKCKHKVIFDDLQNTIRSRGWVCCETPSVQILDYENNMCTICIHAYVAHFSVTSTCIALQSLYEIAIPANGSGEHVLATDSFVYSLIVATGVLYVYDKENGYLTSAVNVLEFIANCSQNGQVVLDQQAHYAILESDSLLVLVDSEKNAHCMDLNKIYIASSTSVSNDLGVGSISTLESMRHSSEDKISQYSMQEMSPRFCANDSSGRFLPFWISSRKKTSRRLTGFGEKESGSLCFNKNLVNRQDCITIPTTRSVRAIDVCSAVFSVWAQGSTDDYGDLLIINMETGSVISSLRFQKPTYVLLSHKSNLPHILIHQNYISAFSYAVSQEEIVNQFMLYANAAAADYLARMNCWDCISMPLNVLELGLKNHQLDAVSFFLKSHDDDFALSDKSVLDVSHLQNVLCLLTSSIKECSLERGSHNFAEQLLQLTLNYLNRVLRAAVTTSTASLSEDVPDFERLTSSKIVELAVQYLIELRSFLKDYPKPSTQSNSEDINDIQTRLEVFPSVLDAWNRWSKLSKEEVIQDAVWNECLPLAHFFCVKQFELPNYTERFFHHCRDIILDSVIDCLRQSNIPRATILLENFGLTSSEFLKMLMFNTAHRPLRMIIEEELKKQGVFSEAEEKLLHFYSLVEEAYPCQSFTKAREMLDNMVLHETSCWHECFSSPLSSSLASLSFSTYPEETLSFTASWVSVNECDNWESLDYSCLLLAWTTSWSQEIWERVISEKSLLKNDSGLPKNSPSSTAFWDYLLQHGHLYDLLNWVKKSCGNECDSEILPWPISTNMVENVGLHAAPHIANCVLDELARYGIFSFHEIDDFMLCIKRLVTCGVKKMQLVCLSLPHSSVTLDEFLKKFAIMCVDNCLAHVLYNYMEQLSATNELLESQEELANPSWFKMMIQFKNWVSHPEDCEAVFQASLYAAEYILKQCCSKPDDILQAGDAITGLATLLYNPGIADTINQEILKLCADDSTLHSVAFSVRSSEIASPQDINVYRLLQGRIPYDVTYLFGWQATNGLKAPDASTELPYFSHPALVKQHGVLQVLDFTLYIKQGRPSFAYAKFIIHCIQKFGTVSPKQIRDACNHAHSIALQHFYSKPVASASVAFMKMLNYKTRGLRIDLEVSQLILTHSNSQIPKLITGQKRDAALKKNQDEIALLLRASVLGQRNSLSKMLELLEESVVAKLKADKIESTSVEACYRWNLVVLFCKRYNLPLTVMFLKVCSLAGDWVMFVFFAEIHKYPKHLILNLSTHYPNKQMVQHLKNAFAQLRSSSVIATQLNGKSKPRDVRASLYSKIGVKTSRKDEKEIAVKLGSCSDDDIKNAPSKAESSDDLTDYSGSSSLTSFEAVPDTLTNDLPADLLSVILYCHQQPCSWHSVLNHAVLLKNPVLAAIAACYKDASVIQCMCVWLLITARGHLWETLSQQASNCFSWDSEDLQTIIVEIMHLKLFHVLTEGLYYFQPDCPLYPLMRFVKDFLLEKSYEGSFAFFTEFQSKMKNLADGFSDCEIGTNEWLKKMTVVIINESFLSITNPFERLKFLKIICDCDVFRSQRSIDNLPDYHLLFRVQELLSSTHVTFNETNLLKPLHDSCHSMECLRIFHCLLQEKQISLAYKFADISSLPKSAVLIFQMQEELSVLEMCPSKNNLHTKLSVWKHCFVLFKENDVPVLEIAKFCKTMVQSYKSSEKYFVLYLAWLMSNPLLPAWSIACEYDEELEREMWLARITAEQEGEDDEFMDIGEVITNLTVFQQNILLLPTARHKTSQCIIQAATNNLNFRQLEWSLKNDKERTALTKIIYQLLDQGQICIAYRLSLLFKQKCDALSIILTCMKLAEGVMPLNEVEMDLRLLLEQGSPVKSHVLSSRFLNPVMTRNSSSVYSLSSLSSVLDTSYDAMTKLESSLEKMAIPQNDVSIAMENLLSRCEAGGLLCISIITLHKIAQVLDVGYMEIMENWNDAQLLKALLQCDAIDRFILAKDYILSYGICDAFIVSFLCDQIVCALRVFTGNATDEDQLLRSSRELILKPTESSAMFFQLVNLCSDPSLLGYRLLELSEPASSDENGYLPLKVELCIHAHSCFAVAVHVEGIAHCLQKVRILSKRLAKTGEFSLMVSLLVGIGRFSEMSYIFDILRENHQFELLFRKGMEKVPNLKTALLDYMCRFHPSDNETLTMIALHFRMYREIAKMLEDSARKQVDHFIFSGYAEQKNPLELLENIMQFFADAAESYTKAECIQHALQCVKQAELIALQIYLLPVGIIILNMSAAQVSEFIVNHQNVYESLIVAEAYNQHQDWSQALYVNFVMKSSVDYLRDFCHKIGLSTGILEEIVTRYKKDGNRTNQMSSNMWQILHCLEDVQMKYELAIQLEFHEFAVKLLHKESAQILKDHVQVCYAKSAIKKPSTLFAAFALRMRFLLIILSVLLVTNVHLLPLKPTASTCGYGSCPTGDPSMINVHLLCHTHDDVGWLKTVDQYFYGDRNDIQNAGVQYILDTVVQELMNDPTRRFIYVESSFFWRWWNSRDDTVHQQVQQLVQSGQLEFIGGGWCMNDEAAAYYVDTIDQMTWGFRLLNDTFGPCAVPRVAWQIDPFGHSREMASLFAQMGFDGLFFGRLDYVDKNTREQSKTMELLWNASVNLGVDGQLFTGVLPNLYQPPSGFCFDITCNDEPIKDNPDLKDYNVVYRVDEFINQVTSQVCVDSQLFTGVLPNLYMPPSGFCFDITCNDEPVKDNPNLKDYNVDRRVDDFINQVSSQANFYATNHIAFTMGSDFQYQDAATWYVNLDKVIQYVNARQSEGSLVNVFYSTPSCYLQALHNAGMSWSVKTDDFFPYASDGHSYWTGYFTSRPAFKGYTKVTNNILQIGKQLSTYANLLAESSEHLDPLRRYQGDAQHHDAITGTAKQHVNDDYTESLAIGVSHAQMVINMAYEKLLPIGSVAPPDQQFCNHLNVSYCDATENQSSFVVTVYNALAHEVHSHVRVPITLSAYTVTGPDGTLVDSQIVPIPQQVMTNPEKEGTASNELVFAVDIPANGFSSYFVGGSVSAKLKQVSEELPQADDLVIQNEYLSVTVDGTTGLLKSITDLGAQKTYNVQQNFYYYLGMMGDNGTPDRRASGAYIFRPNGTVPTVIGVAVNATAYTGSAVQEIQQTFSDYVSQVIRLYPGQTNVELEWLVGPIPVNDGFGKEIITRYDTDLASDSHYYTDANGREILERIRNYRETWDANIQEPVSGNYYPINSRIYIKDEAQDSQLTVITDRSHGGGSIQDGSIEVMLHRRLLYDDAFGVGEPLNEPGIDGKGLIVRGKHYLLVNSVAASPRAHRLFGGTTSFPPYVSIAPLSSTVDDWRQNFRTTYSGLIASLPDNVNLVTLEPWKDDTVLIRLEHFFEKTDDPEGLSEPVTVNLQNLFSGFQILEATETYLGANVLLTDKDRFVWNADSVSTKSVHTSTEKGLGDSFDVTLSPMQIRTFVVQVAFN